MRRANTSRMQWRSIKEEKGKHQTEGNQREKMVSKAERKSITRREGTRR